MTGSLHVWFSILNFPPSLGWSYQARLDPPPSWGHCRLSSLVTGRLRLYPVHDSICARLNRAEKRPHMGQGPTRALTYHLWILATFFGSIHMSFIWDPAIRLANEKGKHTWTREIISSSCPRPRTHIQKNTHPSALMQRVSGPDWKQRELVRDGAKAQNGITGEEEEGGGQAAKGGQGGPSLLFNGRVNKSLVKLSGLQPRVFTALVSITNKSRIALHHHHHHSSPASPCCPLFPWAALALLGTAN